jgi:MHS family proline/betaine transporter-like MFS transporter
MNKRKTVFFSAIAGNLMEYYDFTVYTVFSLVIGRTFFPGESEFLQIMYSLAAFATGFITRPIGGIVFGYIGDKYGRRIALIFSMLGMTIPTFAIGLIPGYNDIGYLAPVLLILMRLMQGLCISGEGAGAAIFVLEHYGHLRPGLTTGVVHGSNIGGTLIAISVGLIIDAYFYDVDFAWRIAFLLGGFMGIVGMYLRLSVAETPIFQELLQKKRVLKAPFRHVLSTAGGAMFLTFCVGGVASSVVYLTKTYVNVFYNDIMAYDHSTSLIYSFYANFALMLSMALFGGLTDIFGKTRLMALSCIAVPILAIPTFMLMSSEVVWQQFFAMTTLAMMGGAISGTAYIFVISLFTPEQRFTGVAFSYNFGIAVFGGTSPLISRWLVETTGLDYAAAFYITLTSLAFLVAFYKMRHVIKSP